MNQWGCASTAASWIAAAAIPLALMPFGNSKGVFDRWLFERAVFRINLFRSSLQNLLLRRCLPNVKASGHSSQVTTGQLVMRISRKALPLARIFHSGTVAQTSLSAVSRVSKPAGWPRMPTVCRLGNRRYSRFGNLRYVRFARSHRSGYE
jgi:hypothetical protein